MDFTNDFFIQAQGVIERTFRAEREKLLQANGHISHEQKADESPVTELDRAMEHKICEALQKFDSSIGFEGEEFGIQGSRETYWLVDPIDGTETFMRGGPQFRNVVTLIDQKRPYFTVIYRPVFDDLYVAAEGEGAFRNGAQLKMLERPLEQSRLEMHAPGKDPAVWRVMQHLAQKTTGIRTTGDFLAVPRGEVDGLVVYNGGGGPWDFAPRALIIQEAGGTVTNIGSDSYDFTKNDMLAAHPAIFNAVMQLIQEVAT